MSKTEKQLLSPLKSTGKIVGLINALNNGGTFTAVFGGKMPSITIYDGKELVKELKEILSQSTTLLDFIENLIKQTKKTKAKTALFKNLGMVSAEERTMFIGFLKEHESLGGMLLSDVKDKNSRSREMKEDKILVPADLVEAVAHIGVDFGFGEYELEQKHINEARKLIEEHKKQDREDFVDVSKHNHLLDD